MPIFFTSNRLFGEETLWRLFPNWMSQRTGTWVPEEFNYERGVPPPVDLPDWTIPAGLPEDENIPPTQPRRPGRTREPSPQSVPTLGTQTILLIVIAAFIFLKK